MKVVFMGTPVFAAASLQRLLEAGIQVPLVLTQPDKPNKRGQKVVFSPVKALALDHGIPVLQPVDLKDPALLQTLAEIEADFFAVVAYGRLLPQALLDIPACCCVNVHASLLPKYRGAAPIHWAVINGEKESGVTSMFMDAGLDTGDILLQWKVAISEEMTTGQLHDTLAEMGGALLLETLEKWMAGQITPMAQNHLEATYSPMISRETGRVDWTHHAQVLHNHIRGTTPYPGAFTTFGDERVKLFASEVVSNKGQGTPGEILTMDRHGMTVQTGEGILRIGEIQLPGKKRMKVEAFLLGNDSLVGSHLGR